MGQREKQDHKGLRARIGGMTDPLVSCICLTRNRREWLPKAIDCFEQQTYSQRELVIVWDGEPVADLVPSADNIRLEEY